MEGGPFTGKISIAHLSSSGDQSSYSASKLPYQPHQLTKEFQTSICSNNPVKRVFKAAGSPSGHGFTMMRT